MAMERAFLGPWRLAQRMGTRPRLVVVRIAAYDPEEFVGLVPVPPAVHRFPSAMAARIEGLARHAMTEYAGDTESLGRGASTPYSEPGSYRSVADVVDVASLAEVRRFKQQAKSTARAAARGRRSGERTGRGARVVGRHGVARAGGLLRVLALGVLVLPAGVFLHVGTAAGRC